jgi:ribosome-binding protein aMBF1 (putative translation factor)
MTEHRCSLCGKSNKDQDVTNMVAGSEGFICGECTALAAEAVATSNPKWRDQLIATLTKLRRSDWRDQLVAALTKLRRSN